MKRKLKIDMKNCHVHDEFFFNQINSLFPGLEQFDLKWECHNFLYFDVHTHFASVNKFSLTLLDDVQDVPPPPPFTFGELKSLELRDMMNLSSDWIEFITANANLRQLKIDTMFDGNYVIIDDEVLFEFPK